MCKGIAAYCSASLSLAVLAPVNVNVNVKRQMYLEPLRYGSPNGYNEQLRRTVVHLLSTCCPLVVHLLSTCCPLVVHLLSTCCPLVVHLLSTCCHLLSLVVTCCHLSICVRVASSLRRSFTLKSISRASRNSAFSIRQHLAMTLAYFGHDFAHVCPCLPSMGRFCRFRLFRRLSFPGRFFSFHLVTKWSPSGHQVVTKWSPSGHQVVRISMRSTELHRVPPFSARHRDCWVPVG